MSETTHGAIFKQTDDREPALTGDAREILDVLGDGEVRQILQAAEVPKTTSELVDELGLSQSTAYRKIGTLNDIGLLERTNPRAPGNAPTRYRRAVGAVTVRLDDGLEVVSAGGDE